MPPKGSKTASKQKGQAEQREDTLQAVLLTDSYEKTFSPFTIEKPRCLLPVANVPLIEYTLRFLANAGIKDILLYVGAHEDQVEEYIKNSKWMSSTSPFSDLMILRCPATCPGDALRDLDKRDLITGDFVLLYGDLISNINLDTALARHRARRVKDPAAIMTMVLRESGRDDRSKPRTRQPFFFIDPHHDRCLHYEEIAKNNKGDRRFHLDKDLLAMSEIDIRGDLIDCNIDICTPEALSLWSDNFDYKSLRMSFLRGVLQDYELNGKTIHTHIVEEGYASRISSLRAYNAVTKDIISRWTYPFTPDCNLTRNHTYRLSKNKIYLEAGVVLARGSSVQARSILGKDTSVGDGSIITDSVLGRRCQIGKNVTITHSYIWDDVVIGDNCTITSAIIANEAVLGKSCTLEPGTLLSYSVRLSNNAALTKSTSITNSRRPSNPTTSPPSEPSLVGPSGAGYAYHPTSSDEDPSSPPTPPSLSRASSISSLPSISTLRSSSSSSSLAAFHSRTSSTSLPSPGAAVTSAGGRSSAAFVVEATASLIDGIVKHDDPETVRLELMGERMAHDASDESVRDALAKAMVQSVFRLINPVASASAEGMLGSSPRAGEVSIEGRDEGDADGKAMQPKEAVSRVFKTYSSLLVQLGMFDEKLEEKNDQVAVLGIVERECAGRLKYGNAPGDKVLLFVVDALHRDLEVVEDEGVLQWWDGDGEGNEVRKLVAPYVQWVREAESESSEEEDEEGSEDEDE